MADSIEYDPNDRRTYSRHTETGAENQTALAMADKSTTAGLAAKLGKSAAPSNDGPEPQAGDFPSLGAFAEARRKYAANKAAKASAAPNPRPTP